MKAKALTIIIALLTSIANVYAVASGDISVAWAGVAGAGIALVYLAVRTLTKYLQGADIKSTFATTEFWGCVLACLANLGLAIAGKVGWAQTGVVVVLLGIMMRVGIGMGGKIPTSVRSFVMFALSTALITGAIGCAWWQKNQSKFECAGIVSVKDAPQLITIVNQCATIAVSWVNVLPCIRATAGTTWPDDVIACFASSQAGRASCPAANTGKLGAAPIPSAAQEKLRAAVDSEYKGKVQ